MTKVLLGIYLESVLIQAKGQSRNRLAGGRNAADRIGAKRRVMVDSAVQCNAEQQKAENPTYKPAPAVVPVILKGCLDS